MNQSVVVEQTLNVNNDHEITGFCFTPQDGNSILSSISAAEWFLYPHSYQDKIQCLSKLFFLTLFEYHLIGQKIFPFLNMRV